MKGRPLGFQGAIGTLPPNQESIPSGFQWETRKARFRNLRHGNFAAVRSGNQFQSKIQNWTTVFFFEGNQITKHEGKQSFEYIVTPLVAGLHEIPPIEFSYFDPFRKVLFLHPLPHPLQVDRASNGTQVQGENYPKQTVESTGRRSRISSKRKANQENGLTRLAQAHC